MPGMGDFDEKWKLVDMCVALDSVHAELLNIPPSLCALT